MHRIASKRKKNIIFEGAFEKPLLWIRFIDDSFGLELNEKINDPHNTPERSLFRAVIMQAFMDLKSPSKRLEDICFKRRVLCWFDITNIDFKIVCYLAELDSSWIIEKFNQIKATANEKSNIKNKVS